MSQTNPYNLRSRTRARASSLSTPASDKNFKVSEAFGNLIVNLLSSNKTPVEGPGEIAVQPDPVESPLTSAGRSVEIDKEKNSVLRPVRSYSDVVRASGPVLDLRTERESTLALNALRLRVNGATSRVTTTMVTTDCGPRSTEKVAGVARPMLRNSTERDLWA
ncbi:hypothetical protein EDB19DRAFT_1676922, partial [Suillus lakei]